MELVVVLGGLFLAVASFFDLRSREVPDWLSFSLIGVGLVSSLFYGLITGVGWGFVSSLLGFLVGLGVGLLMFYSGQWGGGDAKLMMGIGTILGLPWFEFPSLVSFMVLTMVVGAIYGVGFGLVLMTRHWVAFKKGFWGFIRRPKVVLCRRVVILLSVFLLVFSLWLPGVLRFFIWLLIVIALLGYYLVVFMKVMEHVCMIKEVSVARLTEGDWIYKDVVVRGERICGPKDLGVSMEQIKQLKRLKIRVVWVKEGVPFVPSFFIAYLLTVSYGNGLWMWLF